MIMKTSGALLWILTLLGNASGKCFEGRNELADAVSEYLADSSPDTPVAQEYGWPIGKWCVSEVTDFSEIFANATDFNEDLSEWDTSSGVTMEKMFMMAQSFNQPLSSWNTANVQDLRYMFLGASSFDQSLSSWKTSNVQNTKSMFFGAVSFNGDVSSWDVVNCMDMVGMFFGARSFNGDISKWKVSEQTKMDDMFLEASSFQQDLCSWGQHVQAQAGENMFQGTSCPSTDDPDWTRATKGPFCYECDRFNYQQVPQKAVQSLFWMLPYKLFVVGLVVTGGFAWRRHERNAGIDPTNHELAEFENLQIIRQG
jgi:surface protein